MDVFAKQLQAKLRQQDVVYTDAEITWLLAHVGNPRPEIRDGLVYATFCSGIDKSAFTVGQLQVISQYTIKHDLIMTQMGIHGSVTVMRTFAALLNTVILTANQRAGYRDFLDADQRRYFFQRAATYLQSETDFRSYTAELGWIHGLAHGADFLAACVPYPDFEMATVFPVLTAVFTRIKVPLGDDEPARLGMILVSAVINERISAKEIIAWLHKLSSQLRANDKHYAAAALGQLMMSIYVELDHANKLEAELKRVLYAGVWG